MMLLLRVCFVSCIIFICVTVFECNNQISDRALERLPFHFGRNQAYWMSEWAGECTFFYVALFFIFVLSVHLLHFIFIIESANSRIYNSLWSRYSTVFTLHHEPLWHTREIQHFFLSVLVSVVCHSGNTSSRRITCVIIFPLWHNVLSISTYMGNSRSTLFDFQVDLLAI